MTRNRAPVDGGYVRKTVSLPADLVKRMDVLLEEEPGLSMSALVTKAAEVYVSRQEKRRKR